MSHPVTEIAERSPEAAGLVFQIVTASMDANHRTMDALYEQERELRQAYEVLFDDVLGRLDDAHMGSAREYERAIQPLRMGVYGRVSELADRHRQNTEEN